MHSEIQHMEICLHFFFIPSVEIEACGTMNKTRGVNDDGYAEAVTL